LLVSDVWEGWAGGGNFTDPAGFNPPLRMAKNLKVSETNPEES